MSRINDIADHIRKRLKHLVRKEADQNTLQRKFTEIFYANAFGGKESKSGEGSGMEQTGAIRRELPRLLKELNVRSVLDIPCGDWFWMRFVDLGEIDYVGADIVNALVDANRRRFQRPQRTFQLLSVVEDPLPNVDLILCRDLLVHLNFTDCRKAIINMKRSGSRYLLTTTFANRDSNEELCGLWRPLNLEIPPFNLPKRLFLLNEGCTEYDNAFTDKSLGLWKLEDL
jgi:hypothetical protein